MAKTINGKVYDDSWAYLWHSDIVYGTGPIWKNKEKGLTQNLDSTATTNSEPTKDMNAWSGTIKYADPQSPSTNPATRREKYNLESDFFIPRHLQPGNVEYNPIEQDNSTITDSTKIGVYDTISPIIQQPHWTTQDTPTSWIIKDKGSFSYGVQWGDSALELIKKSLEEAWVDSTSEVYWPVKTKAVQDYLSSQYALGELMNQQTWILNKQSPDVQRIIDLSEEVAMARALWINDPAIIAKQLKQEERVIQKIMNWEASDLVTLNQEYVDKQLKDYIRAGEDYTTNIQRNLVQFQNAKQNLDYQFNSAMDTIKRSLFDSERAAKWTAAWLWMTGTKYLIDRIQTQYQQQMDDLQNTYDYQSATAQLAINNALEDYTTNMMRLSEDYDEAYKVVQQNVLATMQNLNNQVWLTIKQQSDILTNLQTNVAQMKAEALSTYLSWLEAGNQTFSNAIANAYGLSWIELSWMWWYYPGTWAEGDLRGRLGTWIANKTNNVWSIKVSATSEALKKLWDEAWIKYTNEWISNQEWAFWTFETVQDWIKALGLALKWRNWSATPRYLKNNGSWAMADLPSNLRDKKINEMTDEEFNQLLWSIIKWENVQAYNALKSWLGWVLWTWWEWWEWWQATYDKSYVKDYDRYLTNWRDSFKKSTQESLIQQFWSMDNFIRNAQEYSEAVIQPQQAQTFQDSLDIIVEFNKAWNKLSDRQRWLVKTLWVKDSYQNWLYSNDVNNAVNLYRQLMAQWFIQNIIDSKKKWATYGPLSDNEWGEIKNAYSSMKLNAPEYVQWNIDYMIYDLSTAITELWWTPDVESWLQRDIGSLYNNPNTKSEFNTPWAAYTWAGSVASWTNYTWAQQSWTVNTGAQQMWWN